MIPTIVIKRIHKPKLILPAPHKPSAKEVTSPEQLSGEVQGKKASAPEERLFKALAKNNLPAEFRRTIGAPRGLPGWKELDALVVSRNMLYAIEVDTAFTHRQKQRADVLHDAIVLQDLRKEGMEVYPKVFHLFGEAELVDQKWADATIKRLFA